MNRMLFAAVLVFTSLTSSTQAQMLGQTMQADWYYPSFGASLESHTVVVSAGLELPNTAIFNDSKYDIDLGDDFVEFRFNALSNWTAASFNGWYFRDALGGLPPITGYTVDSFSAGIGGLGGIATGFTADEFWADLSGMTVAGTGDWIRFRVSFGGAPVLSVSNLASGQNAVFTVDSVTNNGSVGIAFSVAGGGPSTVIAGACGSTNFDLSLPINLLGIFTATGTSVSVSVPIPAGASGLSVWFQALDLGSCDVSNGLAAVVL